MKIVYLVSEFPKLSETFVVDEIKEHLRNGVDLRLISINRPHQDAARSNIDNVDVPILYVFRGSGRRLRFERYWIPLMALLTQWRLWRVVFEARFGSLASRRNILGLAYRLREVGELRDVDLWHCHFGPLGHLAAALRSLGIIDAKIVTTFHGFDISSLVKRKGPNHYQLLFQIGALFLPVSEMWARKLRELGCGPERIKVHHVGVDCAANAFRERRIDARPTPAVKLISIGRLAEKKGHTHTLQALARLHCKRPDLAIALEIVGDGDLKGALEQEASDLGLTNMVTFHGGLPHSKALTVLNEASIFILPSVTGKDGDMEGIPVSLMEAMARGIPVISTYHSGIPELVEDGVSGLLVPEHDDDALARAIERMIDGASKWPEMGRAGRRKIEREFDRRRLGRRLIERYQDVLRQ